MHGIWPILYAYFNAAGALDRESMRLQVQVALRSGAPGIAVLGLATEVNKLSVEEKQAVIQWTAEDLGGRTPMAVTISGATVAEQLTLAQMAIDAHASYLILQPPVRGGSPVAEPELEAFFAEVMSGCAARAPNLPVGIQNAPEFLGVGLQADALARLRESCPNFLFLKGEAPAVIIARTVQQVGPGFPVLNGRGGMELLDNLHAGCTGMIVAPDCALEQLRIARLYAAGAMDEATAEYARILPTIVFVMQSLETLVVYGKRIAAWRSGMDVLHDRHCALTPTPFGLAIARRFAEMLGPLPGCTMQPPVFHTT
jgi:2-keto-3-deoxy-L-arabinonate dehydratase